MAAVAAIFALSLAANVLPAIVRYGEAQQNQCNQELLLQVEKDNQQAKEQIVQDEATFSEGLASVLDAINTVQHNTVASINSWWPTFSQNLSELLQQHGPTSALSASDAQLFCEIMNLIIGDISASQKWLARYLNHRGSSQLSMASRHFNFRRFLARMQRAIDQSENVAKRIPALATLMTGLFQIPRDILREFDHFTKLDNSLQYPTDPAVYNDAIQTTVSFSVDGSPEPPLMQARYDYVFDWLHFGSAGNASRFSDTCLVLESVPVGNAQRTVHAFLQSQKCTFLQDAKARGPLVVASVKNVKRILQFSCICFQKGGEVVTSNHFDHCLQAAREGVADAQYHLAIRLLYSSGNKDEQEAVRFFRMAAVQGHAHAQGYLGMCYAKGTGVAKNEQEAARYYGLAADQGHVAAQRVLGACYQKGIGVDKNMQEAARYYKLAADQGDAVAQYLIGLFYANGFGVPKNDQEAERYLRLAAAQGDVDAQRHLDQFYADGTSVA